MWCGVGSVWYDVGSVWEGVGDAELCSRVWSLL